MDIQLLQNSVNPFSVIVATLLPTVVEWMKDSPHPWLAWVTPENRASMVAALALVSGLCSVATAVVNGQVDGITPESISAILSNFIVVASVAETAYQHFWKQHQVQSK